jgi:hypothetical protein
VGSKGWYNDEVDPALARWHDGEQWTAHTLLKDHWHGPGEPPPPPADDPWIARFGAIDRTPEPATEALDAFDDGEDLVMWGTTSAGDHFAADPHHLDRADPYDEYDYGYQPAHVRRAIDWQRYAAPLAGVAALVIALVAFQVVRDDGDHADLPTERTAALGDIEEAVANARQGLAVPVADGDLKALIRGLCDVGAGGSIQPVAADAAISVSDPAALSPVLAAAARGASDLCPDDTARATGAVDDIVAAAALQVPAATTTTITPITTQGSADAVGGSGSASSTRSSSSSTKSGSANASGNKSNTVTRSETRSQTSTNPGGIESSSGKGDVTDVGNVGNQNQTTNTVVTPPPTTASTDTTAAP